MKKLLTILICLLMILFTSCTGQQSDAETGEQQTTTTGTAAEVTSAPAEETDSIFNAEGFPIFNEVVTYDVMYPRKTKHVTDFENMWYVKKVLNEFNIDLNFTLVEEVGWEEKKNLAFASGDLPDLFLDGITANDENTYGPLGIFMDISSLVEQYAPNVASLFAQFDDTRKTFYTTDGELYCIPVFTSFDRDMVNDRTIINSKWLNDLGFDMPKTLDELYEFLKAVKEGDPNGNGDTEDEIPLGGTSGQAKTILAAVGLVDFYDDVLDGQYTYVPVHENYRYYLEYMNKLWDEGLMDSEEFTQTTQEYNAKAGEYRLAVDQTCAFQPMLAGGIDINEYTGLVPLTSSVNDTIQSAARLHFRTDIGSLAILSDCEHPEGIIRWIDYNMTVEGSMMVRLGPPSGELEGTDNGYLEYEMEDGTIGTKLIYEGYTSYYEFRLSNAPLDIPYHNDNIVGGFTVRGDPQNEGVSRCMFESGRLDVSRLAYPTEAKTTPEEQEELLLFTDINSYVDEMRAQFITGVIEINDDTWNDYVEAINNMGLAELLVIKQEVFDRWNSVD